MVVVKGLKEFQGVKFVKIILRRGGVRAISENAHSMSCYYTKDCITTRQNVCSDSDVMIRTGMVPQRQSVIEMVQFLIISFSTYSVYNAFYKQKSLAFQNYKAIIIIFNILAHCKRYSVIQIFKFKAKEMCFGQYSLPSISNGNFKFQNSFRVY